MDEASRAQGRLTGRLAEAGMALRDQASLSALTRDVVKISEIEGEQLKLASVRSSIARRLGVDIGALAPVDRNVEGVVEMVFDATANGNAPVTRERLFGWHAALFPRGYSSLVRINAGGWRGDATGPMQVVSRPFGRGRVHFEASPADRLELETGRFLAWANGAASVPALIRAALAHLWLFTLHPFDDGNGRIARALGDLFLPVRMAVPSASTAFRRKSSAGAMLITTSWSAPRKHRWMSPNGSPGSSLRCGEPAMRHSTRCMPCWSKRDSGSPGRHPVQQR